MLLRSTPGRRAGEATDPNSPLAGVAAGDQVALAGVYDALADRVLLLARALGHDPAGAQEVLVRTFVQVWRRAPQHDPGALSAGAWVLRIARECAEGHRPGAPG